jgi:hypothetical protein
MVSPMLLYGIGTAILAVAIYQLLTRDQRVSRWGIIVELCIGILVILIA